jgi:breakpoint cluster region protein, putative
LRQVLFCFIPFFALYICIAKNEFKAATLNSSLFCLCSIIFCQYVFADPYEAEHLLKAIDIHAITGLLKMYLRELPEALFTNSLYKKFFDAFGESSIIFLNVL